MEPPIAHIDERLLRDIPFLGAAAQDLAVMPCVLWTGCLHCDACGLELPLEIVVLVVELDIEKEKDRLRELR